jgi:predicted Co/Zn/Cd cation transporter (cation efflux family)
MPKYKTRILEWCVHPEETSKYDDSTTHIVIDDEGAGEYVRIKQPYVTQEGVAFDIDEWDYIKKEIDNAFKQIKENKIVTLSVSKGE